MSLRVLRRRERLLRISALLTLLGLAFMAWSVLEPTPMPTILAMSLGQVIGTSAFAIYLFVVFIELRRGSAQAAADRQAAAEPAAEPKAEAEPAAESAASEAPASEDAGATSPSPASPEGDADPPGEPGPAPAEADAEPPPDKERA